MLNFVATRADAISVNFDEAPMRATVFDTVIAEIFFYSIVISSQSLDLPWR